MKTIQIMIKGIAPMLMHSDVTANPLNEWTKKLKEVTSKRKKTDEDHAEISKIEFQASMYYDKEHGYYVPAQNIEACLLNSAKMFKLGTLIKQAVLISENGTFVFPDKDTTPEKLYKKSLYVDMRTVKIGTSKTVRTRPIFMEWASSFTVFIDEDKMNITELKQIVENAGKYVGIGDYRPRYGRFEVVKFG